jgi:hypothetical protein
VQNVDRKQLISSAFIARVFRLHSQNIETIEVELQVKMEGSYVHCVLLLLWSISAAHGQFCANQNPR